MPFEDNSFDVVLCADTIHHIPDYEKAIKELKRICKKYLIIHEPNPISPFMIYCALSRKEERLIIQRPNRMNTFIKRYLKGFKILYASHISNYYFTNVLPNFILKFVPRFRFVKHGFGTE